MEEGVLWCEGALLVTLSVIYLEFEAHLTSMATTAFCSDMPSHLVWSKWVYHLFFNRTTTQHIKSQTALVTYALLLDVIAGVVKCLYHQAV